MDETEIRIVALTMAVRFYRKWELAGDVVECAHAFADFIRGGDAEVEVNTKEQEQ